MESSESSLEADILNTVKELVTSYVDSLDEIVTFVLLNTPDGLPVITTLDSGTAINEFLSASGSAISEIAYSYSEYTGIGGLNNVVIWGERGHVIVKRLDEHLILAVGFLSRDLRRTSEIVEDLGKLILESLKENEVGGADKEETELSEGSLLS